MISDARGRHVSPGIYTEEKDVTYSVKSLGITSLGLVGETLYGPAFENIEITEWNDFVDYFGGTSPEKFKETGLPKYELPYIAKSYLTKSKRLNVVRVLGLSGYNAGKAWAVYTTTGGKPVIILRSKMSYTVSTDECEPNDEATELVTGVTISPYTPAVYSSSCDGTTPDGTPLYSNKKLCINITTKDGITKSYNVSLDPGDSDYIYKILSSSPEYGDSEIYVEAVFEKELENDTIDFSTVKELTDEKYKNYRSQFRCAQTPWVVSEAYASLCENNNQEEDCYVTVKLRKLFKFLTISDGNAANFQVKVSIEKVNPYDGTFDVVVRDFNDNDMSPIILEKFSKCSMSKGDSSFIGYKIGTSDGMYMNKSKYITVLLADDTKDYSGSVPCGFLGYPCPNYNTNDAADTVPSIEYVVKYNPRFKAKKQYFGISGIDTDFLTFKGVQFYDDELGGGCETAFTASYTHGFHLDSIMSKSEKSRISVDDETGKYEFDCVSTERVTSHTLEPRITAEGGPRNGSMMKSIYADEQLRKFTVCFYGGFDGWDVNRGYRTNTDMYNVNNFGQTNIYSAVCNYEAYKLSQYSNTSDYYAYLAGYNVLSNPQDVEINIFATPGIDWYNHNLLTQDAIHMIEDQDEGRGGDALYIMNSPFIDIKHNFVIESVEELVSMFEDSNINSSYACTYFPWVLFHDTVRKTYLYLPPTKDVVRNIADTDNTLFPWYSPAGIQRGTVVCEKAAIKTTIPQEDVLYGSRINPIKTFGEDGVKVWGNKTAYEVDSPLNRINVRRLMIRVKKLVTSAAKNLIFEQYDDALEKQFKGLVEPILAEVKTNRGIYDFKVITECTPETRDQHILPAKIMIKPTSALEYISISFVVYPESVAFEE